MLKRASPITLAPCSVICEHPLARQGQAGSTRLEPEATQCQSGPLKGPRRSNRELSAEVPNAPISSTAGARVRGVSGKND